MSPSFGTHRPAAPAKACGNMASMAGQVVSICDERSVIFVRCFASLA